MSTAEIKIKLSNGKEAGKTINQLTAESVKLSREIKKLEIGSDEWVKKTGEFKNVSKELKSVKKEAFDTGAAQNFLNSAIGDMIPITRGLPGIAKNFQGMGSMIKGTTLAQKALNLAFKAFPLGLIIGLLGSFVQYLTGTVEGMNALRRVTMPVVQVFERLKGVLQVLGGEVFRTISDIISGKTGLWEGFGRLKDAAVNAGEGFKTAFTEGIEAGGKLAEMHQKIAEQQIKVTKRSAEIARDFKLQSEIAEDQSKTESERAEAARKAMALSEERYKLEADLLDMKIAKMNLENEANDTSYEQQQELADLEAQRINLETQMSEQRTTARSKLNSALKGQRSLEEKSHSESMREQGERLKAIEDEQKARSEFINKSIEEELRINEERKKLGEEALAGMKEQEQERFNNKIEQLILMNDAEQDMINELFFTNQISQQERDQMLYDSQKSALEQRLALLISNGRQTSEEYQNLYMELLALNYEHESNVTEDIRNEEEKRKAIRDEGFAAAAGIFGGLSALLSLTTKENKKALTAMKVLQTAEIGINTVREVSNIFASTSGWGPLGWALGITQAAVATARGASAIKKVNSIQVEGGSFEKGGPVFGKSHQSGGIDFNVKGSPGRFEMEGGEIILTKGVYQDPVLRSLASDINVMAGGRSFALGGPVLRDRESLPVRNQTSQLPNSSSLIQGGIPMEMNLKNIEAYLATIARASVTTANKPPLALTEVREGLMTLQKTEEDARF